MRRRDMSANDIPISAPTGASDITEHFSNLRRTHERTTRITATFFTAIGLATSATAQLPDPGVEIVPGRTALVITDPQNDFLSPEGVTWGVVGKSVTDNNTVENIDALFKAAKANDMPVLSHRTITTRPITAGSSKVRWKP